MFKDERQAEAIASEWGVDVELLNDATWEMEPIDGNDDEIYGYLVRFDDDTDPDILTELGVEPGSFTRPIGLNAFDEPDGDDETDFDSSRPEQVYLSDGRGNIITDGRGNRIVVGSSAPDDTQGTIGGAALNQYVVNGPTYVGASFVGNSFVTNPEAANQAGEVETLRREMLSCFGELEAIIRQNAVIAPNRGHNHPPELLEVEPLVSAQQRQEVVTAIAEIRQESESATPNQENIITQVSVFQRLARRLGIGMSWITGAVATGIIGQEAGLAYTDHKQQIIAILLKASEATMAWLHSLPSAF